MSFSYNTACTIFIFQIHAEYMNLSREIYIERETETERRETDTDRVRDRQTDR